MRATAKLMKFATISLAAPFLFSAAPEPAQAERFDPEKVIRVSVLDGWRNANGTHIAALKIDLAPGWVTYWRVPGDSGIPMQYDWRNSDNIGGVSITWPNPRVEEKYGLTSYVYRDTVVLPLNLTLRDPQADARLSGEIEIGVCKDICVPVQFSISHAVTPTSSTKSTAIQKALAATPKSAKNVGIAATECSISPTQSGWAIQTTTKAPHSIGQVHAVIEHSDPSLWVSTTTTHQSGTNVVARAEIENDNGTSFALQRRDIRVTLLGESQAIDIQGCVGKS